ncbi:carbohydrate ABC transporter permease [Streptomyces sp. VRA16 Mangrove soil]|uniref:carbohydrate ABC transporter permease n=1 Tax=Streptomyces sp. VRA16 Mangrove soil TaxID=2817434 RepID=UPI001A9CE899|nr:carbohydrate ABC transporter permease [Streptomyces sp. VRA16 Mangrove soil]MBO1331073.1 carbohydrate ABC transporter permease [Streptomyces sp. VRA16 Mangrove soil]
MSTVFAPRLRSGRRHPDRPVWMEQPSRAGQTVKLVVILAMIVAVGYPFLLAIGTSLSSKAELAANGGYVLFPHHPTLEAYRVVLAGGVVTRAALVSVGVTLIGTALSLLCTVCLAYGLSRPGTFAGKPLLLVVVGTFLFTPGVIPSYLVVQELGLIDSYGAMVLPIMLNAFNVIVVRAFFQGIPDELHEAARLDGAGELTIMCRIVLPLSKAVIAVVGMFYAVTYWNSFFNAMLYINDSNKLPLQVILRSYVIQGDTFNAKALGVSVLPATTALSMAVLILAVLPIVVVYPFLQKYFVKGVLTGAVKA